MLTNPVYGGAYAYGKTEHSAHYEDGHAQRRSRRKPREQWLALIPNAHEGYVSWETFEQIQQMLWDNFRAPGHSGAAKRGASLLTGLLRCRRCGRKLTVHYTGREGDILRYSCYRGWLDNGEPRCITFGGVTVDGAVARAVLRVIQPGAIEAAVAASEDEARQQDEVLEALERDLEAARYGAHRAWKQYDAADPENRLVADELERRWNQALQQVEALTARIDEHRARDRHRPDVGVEDFEALAADLEALWHHPDTDARLKKRIVRTLIKEVVVDVDAEAGEIILVVHWKGGMHTELRVPRRRRGQSSQHTSKEIVDAVRVLVRVCSNDMIAGVHPEYSCSLGKIDMVKAMDGWEFNDVAGFRYSYWTTVRRIAVQGLVCSPRMVVIQIRRHKSLEMPLVEHDDVVEKFSA